MGARRHYKRRVGGWVEDNRHCAHASLRYALVGYPICSLSKVIRMIDLKPILAAVRLAATVARRVRESDIGAADKGAQDPVTIADYASQVILCRAIAHAYPDDAVLGEEKAGVFDTTLSENGQAAVARFVSEALGEPFTLDQCRTWLEHGRDRDSARLWTVDPIDGTKGYIAGRRYAIGLALLIDSLPIAGVIGAPNLTGKAGGLLFYAQRSAAYVEPLEGGKAARVAVSAQIDPRKWRAVENFEKAHGNFDQMHAAYDALQLPRAHVTNFDSMIKYAMIASGDADLFLNFPKNPAWRYLSWDHAPGTAIVQAAGGVVTDLAGNLLDFSTGARLLNNNGLLITNGTRHDDVLKILETLTQS